MKKVMNPGFSIFVFIIILFQSCTPDSNVTNPLEPRENYIGTWTVQENKKKLTYEVNIVANPNNSVEVLIENFYNVGINPYAIVTAGTITMPVQNFSGQSLTVNGSGSLSGNKITWTYYVNDGADLDTINAVYTKQ